MDLFIIDRVRLGRAKLSEKPEGSLISDGLLLGKGTLRTVLVLEMQTERGKASSRHSQYQCAGNDFK